MSWLTRGPNGLNGTKVRRQTCPGAPCVHFGAKPLIRNSCDPHIYYVQELIYIGDGEESQKFRIIHTLTPEANNCNLLVDRYIKVLVQFCD